MTGGVHGKGHAWCGTRMMGVMCDRGCVAGGCVMGVCMPCMPLCEQNDRSM